MTVQIAMLAWVAFNPLRHALHRRIYRLLGIADPPRSHVNILLSEESTNIINVGAMM